MVWDLNETNDVSHILLSGPGIQQELDLGVLSMCADKRQSSHALLFGKEVLLTVLEMFGSLVKDHYV